MKINRKLAIMALCSVSPACASLMVDKNTHDYPRPTKDAFISSCVKNSGGKQDWCACMLVKVQEHYTYGEMTDIETKIKSGQPPAEFTEFMTKMTPVCAGTGPDAMPSESKQR